jgi:beta-lactamase class A
MHTMRTLILLTMSASMAAAQGATGASAVAGLREAIETRVGMVPGATVAVVHARVGGPPIVEVNADSVFHAASTMKVPVMIEYFRALDDGRLRRDHALTLSTEFRSIVDASPYSLGPGVDSDSTVFDRVGEQVPLRWLVERMIVRSSNLATNALIELLDAKRVDATARALGTTKMKVLRGVEDSKAFQQGLNNQTSARDLAVLMQAIAAGTAASAEGSREMVGILARQEFNTEIPAGLPAGTRVAHKTGWITRVLHDAEIVYPPQSEPYVLVVLTKGIADRTVARQLIADVSRLVWEHATR